MLVRKILTQCGTQASRWSRRTIHTTGISSALSQFETVAAASSSKYQIYLSKTEDPYINLSIEHHLLESTPADSTVLFLYSNRPCVVIGRNQNPWLETNLSTLTFPAEIGHSDPPNPSTFLGTPERVELVRRRSGGGTVFHGPGNVNYSVICPAEGFTRDAHVEMVARALRTMNPTAKVNQRHDIVIEAGASERLAEKDDLPSEASPTDLPDATATASTDLNPRKVSGSAFKLTRARALHHGTCLLCSPYLAQISAILSSPAAPFLQARGVDSVRSAVANVLPPAKDAFVLQENVKRFQYAVFRAFAEMYPAASLSIPDISAILDTATDARSSDGDHEQEEHAPEPTVTTLHQSTVSAILGSELAALPSIQKGMTELRSNEWLFGQTPRFTLSTHASAREHSGTDVRPLQNIPDMGSGYGVYIAARAATITGASYIPPANSVPLKELIEAVEREAEQQDPKNGTLGAALKGTQVWKPQDWTLLTLDADLPVVQGSASQDKVQAMGEVAKWLQRMLPLPRSHKPPPT